MQKVRQQACATAKVMCAVTMHSALLSKAIGDPDAAVRSAAFEAASTQHMCQAMHNAPARDLQAAFAHGLRDATEGVRRAASACLEQLVRSMPLGEPQVQLWGELPSMHSTDSMTTGACATGTQALALLAKLRDAGQPGALPHRLHVACC